MEQNKKLEQTPEQYQKMRQERIANFQKIFRGMIATNDAAYIKSDAKSPRNRKAIFNKEQIYDIVENGDAVAKAQLSDHFFKTSGLYKRIIIHYATFLTYSWLLVPHLRKQDDSLDKKNSKVYFEASDFMSSFQIERKCALFATEVLVKGAYYGIIHDNGEYVVIQKLPFEYCRSRFKNEEDVDIVEFNVAFFDTIRDEPLRNEILKTYPKIVQKAYHKYKFKKGDKWIYLPAQMGLYFSFFEECPFFLDLIPLLDDLEDYKEIDKTRNLQALDRILVQKVKVDGVNLVFEPDEALEMHDGTVEMLNNNQDLDVLTTYCDVELLDLSSDDDEKTEISDVQNLIYESAGLTKELFCATTDAGLQYSLNNDLAMMMILGYRFAHFFTVLTNYKFATKKIKFQVLILPISHYNNVEYTSKAKDLAAFGYSFLTPILSTGINQTNLADLKLLENELLNLDEVLKPLQSAYTQSGKVNAITAQASKAAAKNAETETKENKTDNSHESTTEEETKETTETKENKSKKQEGNK